MLDFKTHIHNCIGCVMFDIISVMCLYLGHHILNWQLKGLQDHLLQA